MYLSVIIPNYNGASFIDHLCRCLASQTLSSDQYEIIFIDNGSTDESMDLLNRCAKVLSNACIFIYTDKQSSYAARNYGVENSGGEVLVFTDIDCRPSADWLSSIYKNAKSQGGDFLLTGEVELFSAGENFNFYEWYDFLFSLNQKKYAKFQTGATANLAVSRSAYERVNGFQPLFSGEDRDFCRRVIAAGRTTFNYCPEIIVFHPARSTAEEIKKKSLRVSEGIAYLNFRRLSHMQKSVFLFKQILGLIFQPHQIRQIVRTFTQKGYRNLWAWRFAVVTWKLGFFSRSKLIRKFINLHSDRRIM